MNIKRIVNQVFSSNTYLIESEDSKSFWIIDPGKNSEIFQWIRANNTVVKGVILTHSHFDHIMGVNELVILFPNVYIYSSFHAQEGLLDSKLNGSYYMEMTYVVNHKKIKHVREGDKIQLFDDLFVDVIETPGHDRDCLSYIVGNNIFTGDALIPNYKVQTSSKYSNKWHAESSIEKILAYPEYFIIWPGHHDKCKIIDLKIITNTVKMII